MSSNISRTHDKDIYLQENRYEETKEICKSLLDRVWEDGALLEGMTVCDIGCAAGEFLYYLTHEFPNADYRGYDVVPDLLEKAKERVPAAEFLHGSVLDRDLLPEGSADLIFMQGVHSIFDDFETCFSNLIHWAREGGRIYVVGMFNPHPVDVWVKYRNADAPDPDHREPGWNIFSQASVSRYLDAALGEDRHSFTKFEMPFDLAPNPKDPVRTWTMSDGEGHRLFTNGLSLICNLQFLEIRP